MAVPIEQQAEPIPGYRLIERLGGGGFGEVWKAEAPGGLFKAIKFVYGDLVTAGTDGHRAEQELKALGRVKTVRHPYILSLERYDIIDGQLLIVMELAAPNLCPLPPGEQPVIARALAKNPDERYPTCADLVRALQAVRVPPAQQSGSPVESGSPGVRESGSQDHPSSAFDSQTPRLPDSQPRPDSHTP